MLVSKLYAPTLREVPTDAEVVSHQLMLRAGMIRKTAGGLYTYLPLAWRTIRKIERIVREEMDAAGGQEIMMPIVQPAELWEESGRWGAYGDEMWRVTDRHGRAFCLGPTHEEMITNLVRNEVRSYKELPLALYQIQNKYRDERRPRFGLMRSREFIMKDLYSFDKDEEGMKASYKAYYDAYTNVFTRIGLTFRPVEADSGAIGGGYSHEFTVLAESGESNIAYCTSCDYAASDEKAELKPIAAPQEDAKPLEKVATPNASTIELVAKDLNLPLEKCIKAVAFQTDQHKLVLCFVRGDHEVNEIKVLNLVEDATELDMAKEEQIAAAGGCPGYMSPIGIDKGTIIIVDSTVMLMANACAGANEKDYHYLNVNPKRDFMDVITADIRMIKEGDPCPHCASPIKMTRGIEVGQVFALGTKYSEALKATFLDENGREQVMQMGCYGIGVGRTMAAAVEQNNDEHGIIWPRAIAPYEVIIVPVNAKDEAQFKIATELYAELQKKAVDVILDDRKERAGVKFKDADLIGYPIRITVSPKAKDENLVELKIRKTGEVVEVAITDAATKAVDLLAEL